MRSHVLPLIIHVLNRASARLIPVALVAHSTAAPLLLARSSFLGIRLILHVLHPRMGQTAHSMKTIVPWDRTTILSSAPSLKALNRRLRS